MNTLKSSIFLFIFLISPLSVAQTTYICLIHGKPAYTTIKQDATCKPSIINGISETDTNQFAPPIQVASNVALPAEAVSTMPMMPLPKFGQTMNTVRMTARPFCHHRLRV